MKVLMVGSGAVGQVLGLFLQKAGADLGFYARPQSAHRLEGGLVQGGLLIYQVSHVKRKAPRAHLLRDYQVVTDIQESQQFQPDQIWFTTPSPVYYTDWFGEFLREVPSQRVVCFAPEGKREAFIPEGFDPARLIFGGITLIAWQGELARGGDPTGDVHFWLPPLTQIPLMGSITACRPVADLLHKAGVRAAIKKEGFAALQAATTALLSGFTAGLELSGWSLQDYRHSPWLKKAARGAQEAALGQLTGRSAFTQALVRLLYSTPLFYLASTSLPLLAPFDLERYLRFHYRKTRKQSLHLLALFIQDGERQDLAMENSRALLAGLQGLG
jgi:2-dehydropantoate 2-reductase